VVALLLPAFHLFPAGLRLGHAVHLVPVLESRL
jgi:hypothetical protein